MTNSTTPPKTLFKVDISQNCRAPSDNNHQGGISKLSAKQTKLEPSLSRTDAIQIKFMESPNANSHNEGSSSTQVGRSTEHSTSVSTDSPQLTQWVHEMRDAELATAERLEKSRLKNGWH
ncbi:hypothetical protein BGZ60DRAFT_544353 [Tricladium varicosporioides]|nr:hypothetical protein BGZ60DRAFT_544353 [Hymenoscyphus varicosporioides]